MNNITQEKPRLHQIIKAISEGMSEEQMTTQLVIPPGVRPFPEIFDKFDFQILQPYIEKFVMMTYDHHHGTGKAGTLPPLKPGWVKAQSELTLTSMFQIVLYLFFSIG